MTLKGFFSMHTDLPICEELAYLSMQDKLVYKQASQGEIEPLEKLQVPNATGVKSKKQDSSAITDTCSPTCDVKPSMNSNLFLLYLVRIGLRPVGHGLMRFTYNLKHLTN